ncbi:hypothetical protein [Lentzea kentuckyensis]|uniref:hypothetical protein n=1 Tax=Lentzea kentuckyensis TaxID=360086 RepID=UPI001B806699|nr:hypothetical protein [Lentzea kentuckyensis]
MINVSGRHSSTVHIAQYFSFGHLTHQYARDVAEAFHDFAAALIDDLPDNPEFTVALRKLLEAKDAAVRTVVFRGEDE